MRNTIRNSIGGLILNQIIPLLERFTLWLLGWKRHRYTNKLRSVKVCTYIVYRDPKNILRLSSKEVAIGVCKTRLKE
jgi:hypothetical protein